MTKHLTCNTLLNAKELSLKFLKIQAQIILRKNHKKLTKQIKNIKNNKAPGRDSFSNSVLNQFSISCLTLLDIIFNSCIQLSYFPDSWKTAHIFVFQEKSEDP